MRDEWEKVTLGEVAFVTDGDHLPPPKTDSGIPFIFISNIEGFNKLNFTNCSYVPESYYEKIIDKRKVKENDILYSVVGSYGIPVIIKNEKKFCFQRHIALIRAEKVNPDFLVQALDSNDFHFQADKVAIGEAQKTVTLDNLRKMRITLPPVTVQAKIAETLSIWDSAVEKTEKLITLEEKRLAAFAVKLFSGKTRFTTKNRYLNEMLKEKSELSTGLEEVFSVSVHKGLVNQIEHLGRSFAAKNTDNYSLVKFGHLVYTKSPTGDFPYGIVKQSSIKKDVIVSPLYGIYEPESYEIGLIVEFFFESPIRCKNYLYPLIQKGAKNTISISNQDFLEGKIYFPENKKDINEIAEFIQMSKGYISLLNSQLEQYKLQKQGLMQKLLTGEWRVK